MKGLLSDVHDFIKREVLPVESQLLRQTWDENLPILEKWRNQVREKGWWLPQISKKYGGMGLSLSQFGQLSEALGQTIFGHYLFNCQAPDAGNMELLIEYASEVQQEQFLNPLLKGSIRSCFAMTEPEYAGSNPVFMGATAVREGDEYVINGRKWFTTGADGAAFAIVMCLTDPQAEHPYRKASQIIVPTDTPGFEPIRKIPVMGQEGGGWMSHSEIQFNNCRVPHHYLLWEEGRGFEMAQTRLGPGRIHHCMRWIGICERAFFMMVERAANRQLGPDRPLASKQTIQNWIAESRVEINAARLLVMDAARKIEQVGAKAARMEISMIKFFCANVLQQVLDRAIQVHGALGLTDDTPLAMWYSHERGARIYDGADEVHKVRVAKEVFRRYSSRQVDK
jgi:acyl-CoA dehydrogenase